jgi:carbon-monoxide dehydrogenase medium subunit
MYTDDFDYYRAESVDEAVSLLGEHDGAELLAGGHGLLTRMKVGEESPPALVDISGLDGLDAVERDGDELRVGALATHADVAESDVVRADARALADAAGSLGDLQVRNGGTLAGNLAHGDARSDPPAAALALGVSLTVRGPEGERSVPAEDLFAGDFETTLDEGDVVTALRVPTDADASAYVRRRNPLSGYASVGVAVALWTDGDAVTEARVAATGAPPHPVRLGGVEGALAGAALTAEAGADAAAHAMDDLAVDALNADVEASSEFRAHLLELFTERAVERAMERAR